MLCYCFFINNTFTFGFDIFRIKFLFVLIKFFDLLLHFMNKFLNNDISCGIGIIVGEEHGVINIHLGLMPKNGLITLFPFLPILLLEIPLLKRIILLIKRANPLLINPQLINQVLIKQLIPPNLTMPILINFFLQQLYLLEA